MSRRFAQSDISVDRYVDRERDYVSRNGSGRVEERYYDEEIDIRRRGPPPRERERERDVMVKEREDVYYRNGPDILREDYGRTSAGPLVLRAREREDFEFIPKPRKRTPSPEPEPEPRTSRQEIIIRRNSPSPERPPPRRERDFDREEIIIRRDDRERAPSRPPRREVERDREEIIIRRDDREREPTRRPPPPREVEREREEIIIRRDDRDTRSRYDGDFERDEVIIRRDEDRYDRRPPPPREHERDEIILRREREERDDDRMSRYSTRGRDDYALPRPISHERERSRGRRNSDEEIIIRRDEREGRNGDREREEIIIRRHSRSPSPAPSVRPPPAPVEPAPIFAPPIHREIIYHERHIDHGYEQALVPRPPPAPSRPPSPPVAPLRRERSEERIEIRRTGERNGRAYDEDIIIDRNEGPSRPRSVAPPPPPPSAPFREREEIDIREERGPGGYRREEIDIREERGPVGYRRDDIDIQEEAEYYNQRALERSYPGEGYHGATRDWAIVDVPPGTRRVRMDGAGGGSQEITWQRYNGVRRSKFMPDGSASDEGYGSEIGRPAPAPAPGAGAGGIGARYGPARKEGDGLWTEITKDLVVREAIGEAGYEFEETDDFYYILAYLKYEDVARLVGLSDDIRRARKKRVREMEWENRVLPPPAIEEAPRRLAIEGPPPMPPLRRDPWYNEADRYIEREVTYRGGRPPPPRW